jgi:hypothetical protein
MTNLCGQISKAQRFIAASTCSGRHSLQSSATEKTRSTAFLEIGEDEFGLRKPFDALVSAAKGENGWVNWVPRPFPDRMPAQGQVVGLATSLGGPAETLTEQIPPLLRTGPFLWVPRVATLD